MEKIINSVSNGARLLLTTLFIIMIGNSCSNSASSKSSSEGKDVKREYSLENLNKVLKQYDDILPEEEAGLYVVMRYDNNKRGIVNRMGKEIVPCIYDWIEVSDGLIKVSRENKYGYIDFEGKTSIPLSYDDAGNFISGFAAVKNNDKYGVINKSGDLIVPFEYDAINAFNDEGVAVAIKDGKYGVIDKEGKVVIPFVNDYVADYYNGLTRVVKDSKVGFYNMTGKEVIPPNYEDASNFYYEITSATKDGKTGAINLKGETILPIEYEEVRILSDKLVVISNDETDYKLVDIVTGNVLSDFDYDDWGIFNEGLMDVHKEGKVGFLDEKGNLAIPAIYDLASKFVKGVARVSKNNKDGVIDATGRIILPVNYDKICDFSEGLAFVTEGNNNYVINNKGQTVFDIPYRLTLLNSPSFDDGLAMMYVNYKGKRYIGFIDKFGKSTFDYDPDFEIINSESTVNASNTTGEKSIKTQNNTNKERIRTNNANEQKNSNSSEEINRILQECQIEITAAQREIEDACRTFAILSSGDIDPISYGQMKIKFTNGVDDLQKKANKAFDECARKLKQAGVSDAVSKINVEKREFNNAINSLRWRTIQQVESVY